jgi:hypothetical protein
VGGRKKREFALCSLAFLHAFALFFVFPLASAKKGAGAHLCFSIMGV